MGIIKDYDNYFLPADNLDMAKDFYKNKLGLDIKFDFPEKGMVAFKVGETEPAIILRKAENVKPSILLMVDDVRKAYKELKAKGILFINEPYEIMTGLSVEFTDPFGNKFGLTDYSKMHQLRGQSKPLSLHEKHRNRWKKLNFWKYIKNYLKNPRIPKKRVNP